MPAATICCSCRSNCWYRLSVKKGLITLKSLAVQAFCIRTYRLEICSHRAASSKSGSVSSRSSTGRRFLGFLPALRFFFFSLRSIHMAITTIAPPVTMVTQPSSSPSPEEESELLSYQELSLSQEESLSHEIPLSQEP